MQLTHTHPRDPSHTPPSTKECRAQRTLFDDFALILNVQNDARIAAHHERHAVLSGLVSSFLFLLNVRVLIEEETDRQEK